MVTDRATVTSAQLSKEWQLTEEETAAELVVAQAGRVGSGANLLRIGQMALEPGDWLAELWVEQVTAAAEPAIVSGVVVGHQDGDRALRACRPRRSSAALAGPPSRTNTPMTFWTAWSLTDHSRTVMSD